MKFLLASSLLTSLLASTAYAAETVVAADLEVAADVTPAKTGPDGKTGSNPCGCRERKVMIDFNEPRFSPGDYVNMIEDRISVSVTGINAPFYAPDGKARIFDSSDPAPDFDLGTPNNSCSGPGRGNAGVVGKPAENCQEQGNLLILQNRDKANPDSAEGGAIFDFSINLAHRLRLGSVGFIDVGQGVEVDITTVNKLDGETTTSQFRGEGGNGYQNVWLTNDIRYYSDVKITIPGEGAIAWMLFCEPVDAPARLLRQRRLEEDA